MQIKQRTHCSPPQMLPAMVNAQRPLHEATAAPRERKGVMGDWGGSGGKKGILERRQEQRRPGNLQEQEMEEVGSREG